MNYKIIWTPRSEKNFSAIEFYLQKKWNAYVILTFYDKVDRLLKIISKNPELFPEINKEKKIRKCVIVKQVTLYYTIKEKEKQIDLVTFWDTRQNPKKLNF
jgi:plasmid stabilization system protein ParE